MTKNVNYDRKNDKKLCINQLSQCHIMIRVTNRVATDDHFSAFLVEKGYCFSALTLYIFGMF